MVDPINHLPDHRKVTAINKMEREENRTAGPKRNKSTWGTTQQHVS